MQVGRCRREATYCRRPECGDTAPGKDIPEGISEQGACSGLARQRIAEQLLSLEEMKSQKAVTLSCEPKDLNNKFES